MYALSLWQPWASLVAHGFKGVETRPWAPPARLVGERIAICATKTEPREGRRAYEAIARHWLDTVGEPEWDELPRACVLATVVLGAPWPSVEAPYRIGAREWAFGNYEVGRWGWPLGDLRPVGELPVRGRQRLWHLPDAVAAELHCAVGASDGSCAG